MKGTTAGLIFLGVCIVLAALLFAKVLTPIVSGILFAAALVFLGLLSGGFRRK
ncbi:MAG: hypothetical protein H6Q37_1960 [Chloroflexi bacterium]|jgi:hypothetical protein|nr:hypothetical protein [Chloroflexota bacterium]